MTKTENLIANSKREFVAIFDDAGLGTTAHLKLRNILEPKNNDYEYIYALGEDIDAILDLAYMQSMTFAPNRDEKDSKGIIIRTK